MHIVRHRVFDSNSNSKKKKFNVIKKISRKKRERKKLRILN